jgi:hypothetical protein
MVRSAIAALATITRLIAARPARGQIKSTAS